MTEMLDTELRRVGTVLNEAYARPAGAQTDESEAEASLSRAGQSLAEAWAARNRAEDTLVAAAAELVLAEAEVALALAQLGGGNAEPERAARDRLWQLVLDARGASPCLRRQN